MYQQEAIHESIRSYMYQQEATCINQKLYMNQSEATCINKKLPVSTRIYYYKQKLHESIRSYMNQSEAIQYTCMNQSEVYYKQLLTLIARSFCYCYNQKLLL